MLLNFIWVAVLLLFNYLHLCLCLVLIAPHQQWTAIQPVTHWSYNCVPWCQNIGMIRDSALCGTIISATCTPALSAYETESFTGITAGNEEFQQVIKHAIADCHMFKGFPIQFVHRNACEHLLLYADKTKAIDKHLHIAQINYCSKSDKFLRMTSCNLTCVISLTSLSLHVKLLP